MKRFAIFSSMVVPAVSIAGVFGLPCRQLAGRCGPGSETCPDPVTSGSAPPPSETQPTAGPFGCGLKGRIKYKLRFTG